MSIGSFAPACIITRGLIVGLLMTLSLPATAGWWQDLWITPHQQAEQLLEQQDFTQLQQVEDAAWQGVGHFGTGEHEQAAERFASGDDVAARYNEATALTHTGEYDRAIELFDDVLQQEPTHEKATHNRAIAEQLKLLQQQQQEQEQGSDGEQGDSGEQGENQAGDATQQQAQDSSADQSSDNSGAQSGEQSGEQNARPEDADSAGDQTAQDDGQTDESTSADPESATQSAGEEDPQTQSEAQAGAEQEPLSEQEQATEQWLRQIPDDPAGLLRRKLQRSHSIDYPDIGDGDTPW